ncbi:MAG: hypothetical protein HYU41_15490 [Candidatus Rokubacteria bacterium]|nr:hypothetical protein [Candidatus Rokubacteria bacterium]
MNDTALLIFLSVAAIIHAVCLAICIVMLRDGLRITRAVGALVIQEEEKTRRLFTTR